MSRHTHGVSSADLLSVIRVPNTLQTSGPSRKRRVQELLEVVGLNPEHYNRFPHEFRAGSASGSASPARSR